MIQIQRTNQTYYCPVCQSPIEWSYGADGRALDFYCPNYHIRLTSAGYIGGIALINYNNKLIRNYSNTSCDFYIFYIPPNIQHTNDLFHWVCRIIKLQAFI